MTEGARCSALEHGVVQMMAIVAAVALEKTGVTYRITRILLEDAHILFDRWS